MVEIATIAPQPNQDVVETLERLVEAAKAGELVSLAYVGHLRDHAVRFGCIKANGMRATMMLGAVSFLQFKINADMDESG